MKAILEILPVDLDTDKCILLVEISNEGFSYAIKDDIENIYVAVAVYHTDKSTGTDEYSIVLQNELQGQTILSKNFKKVYVMYSFGESVLIPFSLYNSGDNSNVLNLIHGDLRSNFSFMADFVVENGMYNSYRLPAPVLDVIKSKFPGAVSRHQYSVLLKQTADEKDKLVILFYQKKIVVMLHKNGLTQFINTFSYNITDDVLYILLNTCKQFEAENIPVEIGGMIEVSSALSREIQKYFGSVSFAELPASRNYSQEIIKHPSHYFSHIFAIDSCE